MNAHPKVLLVVRFKTSLEPSELVRRYEERMPLFRDVPGLLQKYYYHDEASNEWGGVYLWDSVESLEQYKMSDLRKSIPDVYQIVGEPKLEAINVVDVLRDEVRL